MSTPAQQPTRDRTHDDYARKIAMSVRELLDAHRDALTPDEQADLERAAKLLEIDATGERIEWGVGSMHGDEQVVESVEDEAEARRDAEAIRRGYPHAEEITIAWRPVGAWRTIPSEGTHG